MSGLGWVADENHPDRDVPHHDHRARVRPLEAEPPQDMVYVSVEGFDALTREQVAAEYTLCPECRGTGGYGRWNDCPACDGNGVV